MRVYVISSEPATERMACTAKQLSRLEVPYERLVAINGSTLHPDYVAKFRPMTASQVGYFLSHKLAWMQIAYGDQPYGIVLEDDVQIAATFAEFASSTDWIPADAGVVKLDTDFRRASVNRMPIGTWHGSALRRLRSFRPGTGAYLLAADAAGLLLRIHAEPAKPAEDAIFQVEKPWRHLPPAYQLDPAVCIQDAILSPPHEAPLASSMEIAPHRPKTLSRRTIGEARRFYHWVADAAEGDQPHYIWKIVPFAEG
jgi:glycosyl transferase family 25